MPTPVRLRSSRASRGRGNGGSPGAEDRLRADDRIAEDPERGNPEGDPPLAALDPGDHAIGDDLLQPRAEAIADDGRVVKRALPQKPGIAPPVPDPPPAEKQTTDYLALLRADDERRTRTELSALRLHPPPVAELDLPGLVALLERCPTAPLTDSERAEASAAWRCLRPIDPDAARAALDRARRRLGDGLPLRLYLEALTGHLVRTRTKRRPAAQSSPAPAPLRNLIRDSLVAHADDERRPPGRRGQDPRIPSEPQPALSPNPSDSLSSSVGANKQGRPVDARRAGQPWAAVQASAPLRHWQGV